MKFIIEVVHYNYLINIFFYYSRHAGCLNVGVIGMLMQRFMASCCFSSKTEKESRQMKPIDLKPPESKRIKRTGTGGELIFYCYSCCVLCMAIVLWK